MAEIGNIKSVNQTALLSRGSSSNNRAADAKSATETASTKTDTFSLTDTASQLQSLQQKIADTPEVNKERVEALRNAIADGSYQVDSNKVAQNLINFEQQF